MEGLCRAGGQGKHGHNSMGVVRLCGQRQMWVAQGKGASKQVISLS